MKAIVIKRVAQPLDVDGDLSKEVWKEAQWEGGLTIHCASFQTSVGRRFDYPR